jgi:hypothetical protein
MLQAVAHAIHFKRIFSFGRDSMFIIQGPRFGKGMSNSGPVWGQFCDLDVPYHTQRDQIRATPEGQGFDSEFHSGW